MQRYQRIIKALNILLLVLLLGWYAVRWNSTPETIATHYDGVGMIDGYGDKISLLGIPFLILLLVYLCHYAYASLVQRMSLFQLDATKRVEPYLKSTADTVALYLSLAMSYMAYCSMFVRAMGAWFMPVLGGGILIILLIGTAYSWRKRK